MARGHLQHRAADGERRMSTYGPAYDEALDGARIEKQHERIRELMRDGKKRTLGEIAALTGYPESSISAQLRHLRKPKFGSWNVLKERIAESGLWTYWIDGQKESTTRLPSGEEEMSSAEDALSDEEKSLKCGFPCMAAELLDSAMQTRSVIDTKTIEETS